MKSPKLIHSIEAYNAWRKSIGLARVHFVPTMGALHAGHAKLLERAQKEADFVVLSIFVNPTQFGPKEDFASYPRQLEQDLEVAKAQGVDVVFAPSKEALYPQGYSTFIEETQISQPLCGQFRPGHFRGVTTIVFKLFQIVKPTRAFFGLKDLQQFAVLSQMVHDLNLEVEMVGVETVRESDGLALSSRNAYLSAEERKTAPLLHKALVSARDEIQNGKPTRTALEAAKAKLTCPSDPSLPSGTAFQIQYLECVKFPSLEKCETWQPGTRASIAVAAYLGKTRLIDNLLFE